MDFDYTNFDFSHFYFEDSDEYDYTIPTNYLQYFPKIMFQNNYVNLDELFEKICKDGLFTIAHWLLNDNPLINLNSVIYYACDIGDLDLIKFLIHYDKNILQIDNRHPLSFLLVNKHYHVFKFLYSNGFDISLEDSFAVG